MLISTDLHKLGIEPENCSRKKQFICQGILYKTFYKNIYFEFRDTSVWCNLSKIILNNSVCHYKAVSVDTDWKRLNAFEISLINIIYHSNYVFILLQATIVYKMQPFSI